MVVCKVMSCMPASLKRMLSKTGPSATPLLPNVHWWSVYWLPSPKTVASKWAHTSPHPAAGSNVKEDVPPAPGSMTSVRLNDSVTSCSNPKAVTTARMLS